MIITLPPYTSLLRITTANPAKFYPQDWYYDHDFANVYDNEERSWSLVYNQQLPARVWAYAFLVLKYNYGADKLSTKYVWTSDTDNNGDNVYVGGYNLGRIKGFQIHRHLTIRPEMFLNSLEGR